MPAFRLMPLARAHPRPPDPPRTPPLPKLSVDALFPRAAHGTSACRLPATVNHRRTLTVARTTQRNLRWASGGCRPRLAVAPCVNGRARSSPPRLGAGCIVTHVAFPRTPCHRETDSPSALLAAASDSRTTLSPTASGPGDSPPGLVRVVGTCSATLGRTGAPHGKTLGWGGPSLFFSTGERRRFQYDEGRAGSARLTLSCGAPFAGTTAVCV
jgi:hypothetical protein